MKNKEEKKESTEKSTRFQWRFLMTCCSIAALLLVSIAAIRFYWGNFHKETDEKRYDKYYMLITENGNLSVWESVYQGICSQAEENGVYVDWLTNDHFREYSVEEKMRIAIASEVDGIIVTADTDETLMNLINEATDKGIPVVTLYGDSPYSNRCSFVGVGSYNLGKEYGRQALQVIDGMIHDAKSGDSYANRYAGADFEKIGTAERPVRVAALVNAYAKDLDQNILCAGIQETLDYQKQENTVIDFSLLPVDDTNDFSVEESIRDIFMDKDIPDIIICLNERNTTCVYQTVVDYNKVGRVNILGYNDSDNIIRGIDRDVIFATIAIDAEQMGRYCVDALQEYYELGYTSQYFTADIALISKDNVSQYLREGETNDENQ